MIFFTKLGLLTFVIPAVMFILTKEALGLGDTYSGLSLVLSAAIVYLLGKKLNTNSTKEVLDTKTGKKMKINSAHTLFWINMEYWAPLLLALGITIALSTITNGKSESFVWPLVGLFIIAIIARKYFSPSKTNIGSQTAS